MTQSRIIWGKQAHLFNVSCRFSCVACSLSLMVYHLVCGLMQTSKSLLLRLKQTLLQLCMGLESNTIIRLLKT